MRPLLLFVLVWCAGGLALRARPLPVGDQSFEWSGGGPKLTIFTYKPAKFSDGPLFVVFHGVGRNADDYRDYARVLADRFGALVVVPRFDKERFPLERYQQGGILTKDGRPRARAEWTYALIPQLIAHVRGLEGRPALPYYLIGHSAGGQTLVRLAAFQPGEAVRIVAGNPGSELFPNRDHHYPYGFGGLPAELSSDAMLRAYLAAPLTIYLGTADTKPTNSLDVSPAAMRQGPNRLERGRTAYALAEKLAQERGWTFNWRKVEVPGVGHSGREMFAAEAAREAIFGP